MSAVGRTKTWVRRRIPFVGTLCAVRTGEPVVALTFDDGPEPGGTDPILHTLERHSASATFFVLMTRARAHPGLLADVVAAGHEIGLHGTDHRRLTTMPAEEVYRRHRDARAELEDLIDRPVTLMRPPYGAQTLGTWRAARRAGLEPVLWGPSTHDWKAVAHEDRLRRVFSDLRRGSIVLAHDGFAGPQDGVDDGPRPTLDRARLIDEVLVGLQHRGLAARSVSQTLAVGTPIREAVFGR